MSKEELLTLKAQLDKEYADIKANVWNAYQ